MSPGAWLGRLMPRRVVGLSVHLGSEGQVYRLVVLKSESAGASFVESKESSDLADFQKDLAGKPVSLVLVGQGVLTRKIPTGIGEAQERLASSIPDYSPSEFLLQVISERWGAVLRQDRLLGLLQQLIEVRADVVRVSIGPAEVLSLWGQVEVIRDGRITLVEAQGTWENGDLVDVSRPGEEDRISRLQGQDWGEAFTLAYGAGLLALLSRPAQVAPLPAAVAEGQQAALSHRMLQVGLPLALGVLFAVLLGNFLWYSSLRSTHQELSDERAARDQEITEIQNLEQEIEERRNFLQEASWVGMPNASYIVDRLASTVPQTVRLDQILFQPVDAERSRLERKEMIAAQTLFLGGRIHAPSELNGWIRRIESLQIVRTVRIEGFQKDEDGGHFSLRIDLHPW